MQRPENPLGQVPGRPGPTRHRTAIVALVAGLLIGGGTVAATEADDQPQRVDTATARVEDDGAAERRYAEGLEEGERRGREAFERGATGYEAIWRRGYRRAERTFSARAERQYEKGRKAGYDEGYDAGYEAALSELGTAGGEEQPSGDCDPNYAGACLDLNSYDYDCEGGSGDGPDYTGMVQVVGDDPHDLDRDGDGIACDT